MSFLPSKRLIESRVGRSSLQWRPKGGQHARSQVAPANTETATQRDEPLVLLRDDRVAELLDVDSRVDDPRRPPQLGKRRLKHLLREHAVDEDLVGFARRTLFELVDRRAVVAPQFARKAERFARSGVVRRRDAVRPGREQQVGEVAVKDDAVQAVPPQGRDRRRELIDDDDVERFELPSQGPVARRGERRVERDQERRQTGE